MRRGVVLQPAQHPGLGGVDEGVLVEGPDVLTVERVQLLDVEVGRRLVDVLQAELVDDPLPRDDLLVAGWCPPERHQVVAHRLHQVPLIAVLLEGDLVAALRQLLALLVDQHGHVGPHRRRRRPERRPQQLLLRRVGQVLLGADHAGDVLAHVVDDVGQEEHRAAVAAQRARSPRSCRCRTRPFPARHRRRPSSPRAPGSAAPARAPAGGRDRGRSGRSRRAGCRCGRSRPRGCSRSSRRRPRRGGARRRRRGPARSATGSTAPRTPGPPARSPARRERRGCPASSPGGCAPRRCPRPAARTCPPGAWPAPS